MEIAANASNASPENGTAGIPMELTSEATPKYGGSALISSRIGRHGKFNQRQSKSAARPWRSG